MIVNTNAIVLHRMKYKNSSLIARIFTKDIGKMSIIINGAGNKKGNMFGIVEPPNIIILNYYERKSNSLQTCQDANFLYNHPLIKKNIIKLSIGLSISEIIDKTFHEYDINTEVYNLACEVLKALNNSQYDDQLILCFFLINIIEALGFMINLETKNNNMFLVNNKIKKFLINLTNSSINNLNDLKYENINLIDIITLFENYIKKHLTLNKDIESFKMIRDMANG